MLLRKMGVDNSLQPFQFSITCVSVDYKQFPNHIAGIAQLVEHDLAKVGVALQSTAVSNGVPCIVPNDDTLS